MRPVYRGRLVRAHHAIQYSRFGHPEIRQSDLEIQLSDARQKYADLTAGQNQVGLQTNDMNYRPYDH